MRIRRSKQHLLRWQVSFRRRIKPSNASDATRREFLAAIGTHLGIWTQTTVEDLLAHVDASTHPHLAARALIGVRSADWAAARDAMIRLQTEWVWSVDAHDTCPTCHACSPSPSSIGRDDGPRPCAV